MVVGLAVVAAFGPAVVVAASFGPAAAFVSIDDSASVDLWVVAAEHTAAAAAVVSVAVLE